MANPPQDVVALEAVLQSLSSAVQRSTNRDRVADGDSTGGSSYPLPANGSYSGLIKSYDVARGCGWISADSGRDVFFHIRQISMGRKFISVGVPVHFDMGSDHRGEHATNVVLTPPEEETKMSNSNPSPNPPALAEQSAFLTSQVQALYSNLPNSASSPPAFMELPSNFSNAGLLGLPTSNSVMSAAHCSNDSFSDGDLEDDLMAPPAPGVILPPPPPTQAPKTHPPASNNPSPAQQGAPQQGFSNRTPPNLGGNLQNNSNSNNHNNIERNGTGSEPTDVIDILPRDTSPELTGSVVSYFPNRGFGFLMERTPAGARPKIRGKIYVHIYAAERLGLRELPIGGTFTFTVRRDASGPFASNLGDFQPPPDSLIPEPTPPRIRGGRERGRLINLTPGRHIGWIRVDSSNEDVFMSTFELRSPNSHGQLRVGSILEFYVGMHSRGPTAYTIDLVEDGITHQEQDPTKSLAPTNSPPLQPTQPPSPSTHQTKLANLAALLDKSENSRMGGYQQGNNSTNIDQYSQMGPGRPGGRTKDYGRLTQLELVEALGRLQPNEAEALIHDLNRRFC